MIVLLGGVAYPCTLCADVLGDVLHVHTLPVIPPAVLVSTLYIERNGQTWYVGRIVGNTGVVLYTTSESGERFKRRSPLEIQHE